MMKQIGRGRMPPGPQRILPLSGGTGDAATGAVAVASPRPQAPAVAVEGLVKTHGSRRAVDGVSFQVARGETFALLGPNGAGKTTTLEILEGYRALDAGTCGCSASIRSARAPRSGPASA